MDETETKICLNCKREIPCVNYTIHTVHCARNIRVCPVCKEPVPQAELEDHHEKLHKLLPCKQCGESVRGTDLEDHIRDSCGNTIKSCRFCELELPRRELPPHEGYCGVRTEQCPDCKEWVMIKYRQLHVDSNHGFIRLDDDPAPSKKEASKSNLTRPLTAKITNLPSKSNSNNLPTSSDPHIGVPKNINLNRPTTEIRYLNQGSSEAGRSGVASSSAQGAAGGWRPQVNNFQANGVKPQLKRTNDQPQINTNVTATDKVNKDLAISRGAVKKRVAPKPPSRAPPPDGTRDLPYYSAMQRHQREEQQRRDQTAYNLSVGLPPVLSAAAKLDKLRKMDALHNREAEEQHHGSRLQGRVWAAPEHAARAAPVHAGRALGHDAGRAPGHDADENERRRQEFKNLKPMTPQEFMQRFDELQLRRDNEGQERVAGDRFSEIKSSLRELRRGLNEVTAPYNSNNNNNENRERVRNRSPAGGGAASPPPGEELRLPCEFCSALVPADDLVQHQTGCRPDLAQLRRVEPPVEPPPEPRPPAAARADPLIPCEFCMESLPIYLISEHQERCGRNANLLYAD